MKLENVVEKGNLKQDHCCSEVKSSENLVKTTEKMKNRWGVLSIYCVVFTIYDIFGRWNATSPVYRVETRGDAFIFIYLIRVIIYFGTAAHVFFFCIHVTYQQKITKKKSLIITAAFTLSV